MKKILLTLLLGAPVWVFPQAFMGDQLVDQLERNPDGTFRVLVTLQDQLNTDSLEGAWEVTTLSVNDRPRLLLEMLDGVSRQSQQRVVKFLDEQPFDFQLERRLKIVNALGITAPAPLIAALSELPDVRSIVLDKSPFRLIEPTSIQVVSARDNSSEPGLTVIGAPQMWAMGYTGRGTLAYSVDTGVWPDHPALKKQWKGHRFPLDECWLPWDLTTPGDKSSSHGTHTTGTILGLDSLTNDTIGAAFNAYFIATDPVVSNLADIRPLSDYFFTYEWCLNPDGDVSTSSDVPDAINNSWGRQPDEESPYCQEDITQILEVLQLAGIANISSAGNEGPSPQTMSVPHNINSDVVNAFTVGSVNGNNDDLPISDFSSRGPSQCGGEGSLLIKPEVVAPGQSVRSCINQDEYASYSGTSMACPHAVGGFLLLKEAFPYLPGKDLLEAMYYSAIDLGDIGEDNTYGNGIINILNAYNYLIDEGFDPVPPNQSPYDLTITEVVSPTFSTTCDNTVNPTIRVKNGGIETISGFSITYGVEGDFDQVVELEESLVAGEEIEITLPAFTLPETGAIELIFRADLMEDVDEIDFLNNQIISRFSLKDQVDLPFTDTFESTTLNASFWHTGNPDDEETWELFETGGLLDSEQSAYINLNGYLPADSQRDDLIGPRVEMPGSGNVYLEFDLAYHLRNSPEYFHDTLEVWIATDCEVTAPQMVYQKSGESLSTYNVSTFMFVPDSSNHWRHETIDISDYADENVIVPVIRTINRKGNNVYIDNVSIYQDFNPLSVKDGPELDVLLFPNPAADVVNLRIPNVKGTISVNIFDATGMAVSNYQFNSTGDLHTISTAELSRGLYLVRVNADEGAAVLRMVKE